MIFADPTDLIIPKDEDYFWATEVEEGVQFHILQHGKTKTLGLLTPAGLHGYCEVDDYLRGNEDNTPSTLKGLTLDRTQMETKSLVGFKMDGSRIRISIDGHLAFYFQYIHNYRFEMRTGNGAEMRQFGFPLGRGDFFKVLSERK